MYMESEPMNALDVAGCFEKENEDEDELKDGSEFKDLEDEVEQRCEEVYHHPFIDYDEEDPPIKVGTTYPNMAKKVGSLSTCNQT
jgi:hypothetical protein